MTIALVGFTDSYNDRQWLGMARAWVARHDPAMAGEWASAGREVFDLRGPRGRDFLADGGVYDVVVLFAIYNPPAEALGRALGRWRGQTALAAGHSRANWVARLAGTGAKYVLVFRRPDSVDGAWLGEIGGYARHAEMPGVFGVSVYERNGDLPTNVRGFILNHESTRIATHD
jgi:hypothetical protein